MRLRQVFLTLMLLLTLPLVLHAQQSGDEFIINGITYVVLGDLKTVGVRSCTTTDTFVEIPNSVSNGGTIYTVTQIGQWSSPEWSSNITSVKIPDTVTTIGLYAFRNTSITSLTLPASVTSASSDSFYLMEKLQTIYVDSSNAKFESDDDGLLYTKGQTELVCVPVAHAIGNNGTFTVKDGVTTLQTGCIRGNSTLKKIVIPNSVTKINLGSGKWNSNTCRNFAEYEVLDGNPNYASLDGVLFDADMTTLLDYPRAKTDTEYKVPSGVKEIALNAIQNVSKLITLNLNQVETIAALAIADCSNLTTLTIPATLTQLEGGVSNCTGIMNYEVETGNPVYSSSDGIIYNQDGTTLILFPPARTGSYTFPDDTKVVTIDKNAFYGARISSIVLPETLKEIKASAFATSLLTSVVIPSSVETIGNSAFYYCSALASVTFEEPSSCATIGNGAFSVCRKLEEITLPKALTSISQGMFASSSQLKKVNIPDGSQLENIKTNAFGSCTNLEELNFLGTADYFTTIEARSFPDLTHFKKLFIPSSTTSIGKQAFKGCSSLETVLFGDDSQLETISEGSFADCGIVYINLPDGVKTIQREAFRGCTALETVTLSSTTQTVSHEAFKECDNLTAINVDHRNPVLSSGDGMLMNKAKTVLKIFPQGKGNSQFTLLPPSLKEIGEYAFYNCLQLTNVTIPNKVNKISKKAFSGCTNLTRVTLLCDEMLDPDNIAQAINEWAFDEGLAGLTDMYENITLCVREDLYAQYAASEYYQRFGGGIETTFHDTQSNANEEYITIGNNRVDLLATSSTDHTYIIPRTVSHGGTTYQVAYIGDYAFQGNEAGGVKEIVIQDNVEYIGAKAFMTNISSRTSTVESVFFIGTAPADNMLSTTRFDLYDTGSDYSEVAPTTHVYMKKSVLENYQTVFDNYMNDALQYKKETTTCVRKATPELITYQIPLPAISGSHATMAREFDIDLGDTDTDGHQTNWNAEKGCPALIAFTASDGIILSNPRHENNPNYKYIRMYSIFNGSDTNVDGLYVPANTGVVLKVTSGSQPPTYYRIGEQDMNKYDGDNVMKGVTVNNATLVGSTSNYWNLYIAADKLYKLKESQQLTMPVHRAYMQISAPEAGVKVLMVWEDTLNEATTIEAVNLSDRNNNAHWYSPTGSRLHDRPTQKGIYLRDGKKYVVK